MLLRVEYEHNKYSNKTFVFVGTIDEWNETTNHKGGVFIILSIKPTEAYVDIKEHAEKSSTKSKNPFSEDSVLFNDWNELFDNKQAT